ncbi:actin-3-like [Acipenser oxyrinchus oxyrinchus]|uniref:Actin-3-like n=1 Tax=Acipenser oxyrinchus oxyrinchus TaxID=40147 RepID=A0AAD8FST4_ACIOX|nr:actin-3-like [Acipenser oxyrinchus oxyrinchus]
MLPRPKSSSPKSSSPTDFFRSSPSQPSSTSSRKPPSSRPCSPSRASSSKPRSGPGEAQKAAASVPQKGTRAIVMDMGTWSCKAGLAGDAEPSSRVGSVVGYPLKKKQKSSEVGKEAFVGKLARAQPDLDLVEPVSRGIVVDWEAAEELWRHVFYRELKVSPSDRGVLLTDPPTSPTTNREKIAEVLFETFDCPGIYVAYQSVLAVYSYGLTSGLVVDCGAGATRTVPVSDGYNLPHAIERVDLAGEDLTQHLSRLLQASGSSCEKGRHVVEDIKHKCCYVASDFPRECKLSADECGVDYELPDGSVVSLGQERFRCPEALFRPSMLGSHLKGVPAMALHSLSRVKSAESRAGLYGSILLSGGSTMFPGFQERFHKELLALGPEHQPRILSDPKRKHAVWVGGSILASLAAFQSLWVKKTDYQEVGPYIIHRRCY